MITIDLDQKLRLDLKRDIIGRRIAILGSSKQGKTNTAAVLVEELLTAGLPLTIVDFKGEYQRFKGNHQIRLTGRGSNPDFSAGPDQAANLAVLSVNEGNCMILDMASYPAHEQLDFLLAYLTGLWGAINKKQSPYGVIFEEGFKLPFQTGRRAATLKLLLQLIALNGPRTGIGTIVLGKPTSDSFITPDFIRQQDILFLHGVNLPSDQHAYKDLISVPPMDIEDYFRQMQPGQAVVVYHNQTIALRIKPWQPHLDNGGPSLAHTSIKQLQQFQDILISIPQAGLQEQQSNTELFQMRSLKNNENKTAAETETGKISDLATNPDKVEWLQKRNRILQLEIERLTTLVLDQSLELATLKDFKTYLESQSSVQSFPHTSLPTSNQTLPLFPPAPKSAGHGFRVIKNGDEGSPVLDREIEHENHKDELIGRQLRQLKPFLYRLNDLNNREVTLLSFLMAHDGVFFPRLDVLKYTGLFMGNFHRDFKNLLNIPFIEEDIIPPARIRSRTKEWAKEKFAGIDPAEVIQRITEFLR